MSSLNLKNLKGNKTEILKAEVGALLFNLGKTHAGVWKEKGRGKNKVVYFEIDDCKFQQEYRYKTFSGYKNYYKIIKKGSKFNPRTPFIADMDHIDRELRDFFNETEIHLSFKNKESIEIQKKCLKLIDVVKGNASDNEFIKKVMFRGCENINSGIDKGAPKKKLNNLQIANAFGTVKEDIVNKDKKLIDIQRFDESRLIFLTNLWGKICSLGKFNTDIYELREFILTEIENWYSHLLSDSRFPINDITLWDQAYMTASMFKASVAALCLDGEKCDQYMKKPSSIKWSILGIQYDKLGLAEKALNPSFIDWYREETNRVDEAVKKVIEEDYALGNEIYRDETGIYFVVPDNICGAKLKEGKNGSHVNLYRLNEDLNEIQEKIVECFKKLDGEVFPAIFVTEPSRGTMNIAYLIKNAKQNFLRSIYPQTYVIKKYFGGMDTGTGFKVVCDVCKVRLTEKDDSKNLNLCRICSERQKKRQASRINSPYEETIWIDELQDANGRIALVTMKFELDEWLNGNMVNTMLTSTPEIVSGETWDDALKDIEDLLRNIKETYSVRESDFDGRENYRLKRYEKFIEPHKDNVNSKESRKHEVTTLIEKFLSYFDQVAIKAPYEKVINFFEKTPPKNKKADIYRTFDIYFYPFLEELVSEKFEDLFTDNIKHDDECKLYTLCHRFEGNEEILKKAKKDWGSKSHTVAKGIFSFAYITEQIKNILLERSIGDEWEKFLKTNLNDKIDFENRQIKWDKLEDYDIQMLANILLQFLTRKNPSPARFRRIWETTEGFFIDIENQMLDILEIPDWRNVRIKWDKVIEEDQYKVRQFEYRGLSFASDEEGNLYLISSIEKAIPILRKEEDNEGDRKKAGEVYVQIVNNKSDWIKDDAIELIDAFSRKKYEVKLKAPHYILYKPYLSIIDPTPISWQFVVPAEYVPNLIKKVQIQYDEEFKYVKGKLPLHIGIVFQDYKKPLYIGIKALRNIRRDIDGWDILQMEISGDELRQIIDEAIDSSNSSFENITDLKNYYSLFFLKDKDKGDCEFYIPCRKENPVGFKSVARAESDETYFIFPNTIDFEYLDVNTRRNDIYYDTNKGNRDKLVAQYKESRPYTWEEWVAFYEFYDYFKDGEMATKLQIIVTLIYSKLAEWENDISLKHFMLSAFINTFDLHDDESKNEFAKIFEKDVWGDIEDMGIDEFRKELYRFLDMYDFWHNGLKKV